MRVRGMAGLRANPDAWRVQSPKAGIRAGRAAWQGLNKKHLFNIYLIKIALCRQ
jgi:hypothetical protein